jgi:hypothetical protein
LGEALGKLLEEALGELLEEALGELLGELLRELLREFAELLGGIGVQAPKSNNGRVNTTLKSPEILTINKTIFLIKTVRSTFLTYEC